MIAFLVLLLTVLIASFRASPVAVNGDERSSAQALKLSTMNSEQ
jgi:hypothetical protein